MRHPKHPLTIVYYIILLLAVLAAMIGYYLAFNRGILIPKETTTATTIYTIILCYVIITLPLSFSLFTLKLKKIRLIDDQQLRYRRYVNCAALRLVIISVGLTASILFYYLTKQMSLFWLAGIEAIGAIICKPTVRRIEADLETDNGNHENGDAADNQH